jgi:hypothetical protein
MIEIGLVTDETRAKLGVGKGFVGEQIGNFRGLSQVVSDVDGEGIVGNDTYNQNIAVHDRVLPGEQ